MFRPAGVCKTPRCGYSTATEVFRVKRRILTPGEMAEVLLKPEVLGALSGADVTVTIEA